METQIVDYLVIGAGPAGLQLGYFLDQAGRDYQILEAGSAPGRFFETFPRHRRMISIKQAAYRARRPGADVAVGLELAAE